MEPAAQPRAGDAYGGQGGRGERANLTMPATLPGVGFGSWTARSRKDRIQPLERLGR